jgi:hypothetical protein
MASELREGTAISEKRTCHFCGAAFDLGYHYTCHICEATYCYIHMSRHAKAHPQEPGFGTPALAALTP